MIFTRALCLAALGAALTLPAPSYAHGGVYRGPGDTVPPNPGGHGGGKTGRPGAPGTGSPTGPTTPNPNGPRTGRPTPPPPTGGTGGQRGTTLTGQGGMTVSDDLTQWQFWWEFNKDPFLQLKDAIHAGAVISGDDDFEFGRGRRAAAKNTLAPSDHDRQRRMIPALVTALKDPSSNQDIVSSSMIALAKIGSSADPERFRKEILPLLKSFLSDQNQEKRESAALAMGIAALPEAVPDLIELAKDSAAGRRLCERSEGVEFRTRAFSCYGLGLIAYRSKAPELKSRIFETMRGLLEDDDARRDLQIAALNALRLLRPDVSSLGGKKLQMQITEFGLEYLHRDEVYDLVRSHAIAMVAKVCEIGCEDSLREQCIALFADIVDERNRKWKKWTRQSAVQALGVLCQETDTQVVEKLMRYCKGGKDTQSRNFAAIALGQIGGENAREFLYKQLRSSSVQKIYKPWYSLGLAVRDHELREDAESTHDIDRTVCEQILREMKSNRNALYAAGHALALGIMRYKEAGDPMLDRLLEIRNQEEAAGYFMLGLGLMKSHAAVAEIRQIVRESTRRDLLLTQGATALGLLGDKEVAAQLVRMLEDKQTVAVMSSLAQALGFIGDRNTISPLVELLENKDVQPIPRAFAAVALGLVGDKERLPWNSKIAVNINYRANIPTLTGGGTGILDIL